MDLLTGVPDPRRARRVRYPVSGLIAGPLCAMLTGARSFSAIGEWARDAGPVELGRLGLRRGPDESTLRRLFAVLDADLLDRVLGTWAATRAAVVDGRRVIAVDGKTVRHELW